MSVQQQTVPSVSAVHSRAAESAQSQSGEHLAEYQDSSFTVPGDAFDFWKQRQQIYKQLAPLAEHLLAAPALSVHSLCGFLIAGRQNKRARKSLEMRVCLRLNKTVLTCETVSLKD